ncbi:hypothetical protein SLEP1_g40023 [Rubroshorea leprosula]|uniref:Uncharacterized protein n=1 Tax=Rubroshorea leprosula TaxID=152421 RepID=A0AAV5L2G8_9ROSI|nr:hypothetical protein SLEP1_g40023 [Rubroshorea leprosula]
MGCCPTQDKLTFTFSFLKCHACLHFLFFRPFFSPLLFPFFLGHSDHRPCS